MRDIVNLLLTFIHVPLKAEPAALCGADCENGEVPIFALNSVLFTLIKHCDGEIKIAQCGRQPGNV